MSVTINVNNLSLVHKGSDGVSIATLPDVCKTPSPGGPVPLPYPNISRTSSLSNGTTTVKADGGNMIAIDGSEFSSSNGDEAGTAGGVTSNVNMKESKWVLYSFDVKMDGSGACRLTDKKTQNHANTVDALGEAQMALVIKQLQTVACECQKENQPDTSLPKEKQCEALIDARGKCVTQKLKDREKDGTWANTRFEAPDGLKNPKTDLPVTRLVPDVVLTAPGSYPSSMISVGKLARAKKANMTPGPVEKVADFKFPCPPSTKTPYPDPKDDGAGYGVETGGGVKENSIYRDLTSPPSDVEVITPNEETCG